MTSQKAIALADRAFLPAHRTKSSGKKHCHPVPGRILNDLDRQASPSEEDGTCPKISEKSVS